MQILALNNAGRKFHKFIGNDNLPDNKRGLFGNPRPQIGDFWALKNIYMSVDRGEIVGVIGRNGSGKTTLLNIISGSLPVTEGEVILNGKVSAMLALGAGFQDEFSGRENVYLHASLLGLKKQEIEKRFAGILEFSELGDFINAPLGSYSSGMKMRLGFSIAIHNDFDILLTDEIIAVGDISFQKRCFQKMLEFKEQGKSMLIVTQDMAMIRRFCDRAYLLEDGKILFKGDTSEAVERYEMLLAKKRVLSENSRLDMVKETKRWATDVVDWGKKEGSRQVDIKDVVVLNRWGLKADKVKTGERITIKAYFTAKEEIENFHFGAAIFREDGVYCYGPNTKFDGLSIRRLGKGSGSFELQCKELPLMPGIYYLSVAVWDENETFAYAYHKGRYAIEVKGSSVFGQLLALPSRWSCKNVSSYIDRAELKNCPNLDFLENKWGTEANGGLIKLILLKCLDNYGNEDTVFVTGRDMKIKADFEVGGPGDKHYIFWLGIFRSDGIYCHGNTAKVAAAAIDPMILTYPRLKLLPGGYRISIAVWDTEQEDFSVYSHGKYAFSMVSEKRDHGTIYLEHRWDWKVPSPRRSK